MVTLSFCSETWEIWAFIGQLITIFKIVIPVLIIIMGALDLGKAVVSSDEKEIKKATGALVRRFLAGIIIFFIPMIVNIAFGILDSFDDIQSDYAVCSTCVADSNDCEKSAYEYCSSKAGTEDACADTIEWESY